MKNLEKWQIVSFASRGVAMGLGIIQGIFIVRILSVTEYGMVGIVAAIGSIVGVYQHLGLASGSTREISSAKDKAEIFKIFITSVVIRYCITIPLALGLFLLAPYIAEHQYSNSALITPIRLFALVLMVQSVQSMFNSVISGMQRFKLLFIYQAVIAFVSVALYIPLVYFFKVNGYFMALLAFNIIATTVLSFVALKPLFGFLKFPSKEEFKVLFKDILSISLGVYVVKIAYTMWQRSGPLILGLEISAEQVGFFSFALFYATKLMAVSDAVTDVNLSVLSKEYTRDLSNFKKLFSNNFDKVFALILFSALTAIYWAPQIINIAIGEGKYDISLPLIFPMVFAFIFYSVINIVKSSVIVPAKMVMEMIVGYSALLLATVVMYYGLSLSFDPLISMAYAMLSGSLVGLAFLLIAIQIKIKYSFFTASHILLLAQVAIISLSGSTSNMLLKSATYVVFSVLFFLALYSANFITKSQIAFLIQKINFKGKVAVDDIEV